MMHVLARADLMKVESISEGYFAFNLDLFEDSNDE